jgi:hypothetical protein
MAIKNCTQIVPKICKKFQKTSKYIKGYRKRKGPEKLVPTEEIIYFLRFLFDCGRLHTGEVTCSNYVNCP